MTTLRGDYARQAAKEGALPGNWTPKISMALSEGGTDSDELCLEPIREEEPCQIS